MLKLKRTAVALALLLIPAGASAQTTGSGGGVAGPQTELRPGQVWVSSFMDRDVYASDGSKAGEVEDLIIDGSRITAAVIELDYWLGIGDRKVAVPMEQLRVSGDRLVVEMTREALGELPMLRYDD